MKGSKAMAKGLDDESPVRRNIRGRPRDPAVDEAVFRATIEALAADGYGRISISDISSKSGITRPTIYLRWKNLHDLVVDALDWYANDLPVPEAKGDELIDALQMAVNKMVPPGRRDLGLGILGHVIADARQHPDLLEIVKSAIIDPYRKVILGVLSRYMDEGIIRKIVPPEILADLMMGNFFSVFMTTGDIAPDSSERIVEAILLLAGGEKGLRGQSVGEAPAAEDGPTSSRSCNGDRGS